MSCELSIIYFEKELYAFGMGNYCQTFFFLQQNIHVHFEKSLVLTFKLQITTDKTCLSKQKSTKQGTIEFENYQNNHLRYIQ